MNHLSFSLSLSLMQIFAIENTRIEVGDGTMIERGTVVVDDAGVIQAVGPEVMVPAAATRIDGAGRVLTPGLIETQSQLGLVEVLAVQSTDDSTAYPRHLQPTPGLRASDGYNPFSVRLPLAREEGITTFVTSPKGVLLYGTGFVQDTRTGLPQVPPTPVGMFGGFTSYDRGELSNSRLFEWMRLREIFSDARRLQQNPAAYDQRASRDLALPRAHLEALAPVLKGQLPLVLSVHRASDIVAALSFAKEFSIRLIIAGGAEAYLVADQVQAARVPVIVQPSIQQPRDFDMLAAKDDLAARLYRAGVPVVLSAGEDWDQNQRRLRQEAGAAVAEGLPYGVALQSITETAARTLGLTDRGRIARGLRADLVLWSGDPFELSSLAEQVWIQGAEQPLDTRQRALARKYLRATTEASAAPDATP